MDVEFWQTGFYCPSFVYPFRAVKKEGLKITSCSVEGGKVHADPWSLELWDHPICNNTLALPECVKLLNETEKASDLFGHHFDLIHFVGGHGAYFDVAVDEDINRLVRECYENGGIISANSDGVVGLLNVKLSDGTHLLKGKHVTGLPIKEENRLDCKDDLPFRIETAMAEHGAAFKAGIPVKDHINSSANIITGQNPNSSEPLSRAIANCLRKKLLADAKK